MEVGRFAVSGQAGWKIGFPLGYWRERGGFRHVRLGEIVSSDDPELARMTTYGIQFEPVEEEKTETE